MSAVGPSGGSTSVGSARSSREGKPSTTGPSHVRGSRHASGRADGERQWTRFVALGDSFTEGMQDDLRHDGRHLGWADRVAQALADDASSGTFQYANLAVRGRLLPQVITEQVPAAIGMQPDLVTLGAGVNDALRRTFDLDAVATQLERGVRALRASGADVVLFAFGDPARRSAVMGLIRDRIRALNSATLSIADVHGCRVVDFWGAAVFDDDRVWDPDRLHLSPAGHRLASDAVLEALGRGDTRWRTPGAPDPGPNRVRRVSSHVGWAQQHAAPWVRRRLRGESSGDAVTPKNPDWTVVHRGGEASTGD